MAAAVRVRRVYAIEELRALGATSASQGLPSGLKDAKFSHLLNAAASSHPPSKKSHTKKDTNWLDVSDSEETDIYRVIPGHKPIAPRKELEVEDSFVRASDITDDMLDDEPTDPPSYKPAPPTPKQKPGLPSLQAFDVEDAGPALEDELAPSAPTPATRPVPVHEPPQVSRFDFAKSANAERSSTSSGGSGPAPTPGFEPFFAEQPKASAQGPAARNPEAVLRAAEPAVASHRSMEPAPAERPRNEPTQSRFLQLDPLPSSTAPSAAPPPLASPELTVDHFQRLLAGLALSQPASSAPPAAAVPAAVAPVPTAAPRSIADSLAGYFMASPSASQQFAGNSYAAPASSTAPYGISMSALPSTVLPQAQSGLQSYGAGALPPGLSAAGGLPPHGGLPTVGGGTAPGQAPVAQRGPSQARFVPTNVLLSSARQRRELHVSDPARVQASFHMHSPAGPAGAPSPFLLPASSAAPFPTQQMLPQGTSPAVVHQSQHGALPPTSRPPQGVGPAYLLQQQQQQQQPPQSVQFQQVPASFGAAYGQPPQTAYPGSPSRVPPALGLDPARVAPSYPSQFQSQQLLQQQQHQQQHQQMLLVREQAVREQQLREQQLREQQLREQQLREQIREQQQQQLAAMRRGAPQPQLFFQTQPRPF